jgi:peptidoglycan-associated lipoprotein
MRRYLMRSFTCGLIKAGTVIVALALISGCGSQPPAEIEPTPPAEPPPPVETPVVEEPVIRDETPRYVDPNVEHADVFRPIHFEFNKWNITPESKPILEGIASLLKQNPDWRVLVEGHCDERGTNEYNLGLGENRAQSTKRYLVSLGVRETRFQTRSYGEERPMAFGHNEAAWAKNRRSEFRVEAPRS